MAQKQGGAAQDAAATEHEADRASEDSPKRHGDKLGVGGRTGAAAEDAASAATPSGDSPKPHGDELRHAVDEASKR